MPSYDVPTLIVLALASGLTALGGSAMGKRGFAWWEIMVGAFFLGPLLVLAHALSDKRPWCHHCKRRNEPGVKFCNHCSQQFRALLPGRPPQLGGNLVQARGQ